MMKKPNLFPYQRENIEFLISRKKVLLADDMGYGKTRSVLYSIVSIPAIVVCPKNVINEWIKEIEQQKQFTFTTTDFEGKYAIYIFNYEKLLNELFLQLINKIPFNTIVLDECHRIRNEYTKTHNQVCKLHKCEYRYALSGTPLVNNLNDVLSIFRFLQTKDIYNFVSRKKVFGMKVDARYLLKSYHYKKLLKKYLIRHDEELLDQLPSMTVATESVDYNKIKEGILVNSYLGSSSYLGAFQTLRSKACNNPNKFEYVLDFIKKFPNANVVIFADFLAILSRLYACFPDVSIITGKKKVIMKDSNIMICSRAGDLGLNLQKFNFLINLSPPLTYASLIQRYKRIYRIGQENECMIINLISKNSVEEYIYQNIIHKKKVIAKEYIGEYLNADRSGY